MGLFKCKQWNKIHNKFHDDILKFSVKKNKKFVLTRKFCISFFQKWEKIQHAAREYQKR